MRDGSRMYVNYTDLAGDGRIVEYTICAVSGGYVYRGARIPGLTGAYVFADFCNGRVMGMRGRGGAPVQLDDLGLHIGSLASFGEGADGELYVCSLDGDVARIDPT